jgi:hypothetical protein
MMALETLRHWFQLRRLQREKHAIRSFFKSLEQKAIQGKNLKELEDVTDEELRQLVTVEEKIARLQT